MNSIDTRLFLPAATGGYSWGPLYIFKTTHDTVIKIAQSKLGITWLTQ